MCQLLETSGPEAESERGDRPRVGVGSWPRVLRGPRVSWCPARRAPALCGIAHPAPEARLSLALAVLFGQLRCVSCGGPEQWAGGGNGKQSGRTFKTPTVSPASACLCPCGWSVHCLKFNCFFILSGHAVYHSLCLKSGSRGSDRSMAIRQQNTALLLSDSAAALFSPPTSHLRASTDLAILTVLPFPES